MYSISEKKKSRTFSSWFLTKHPVNKNLVSVKPEILGSHVRLLTVFVQSRKITDLLTVRSYRHDKKSSVWFANGSYKLHNLKTKAKWRVKWMTHRDTQQTIFSYLLSLHLPWAIPPPPPRRNSNKKVTGMLVVRVRGVNFGFSVSRSMLWVKLSVSHSALWVKHLQYF